MLPGYEEHQRLIETARGGQPADLLVRGGKIANVYSGELHEGDVAVTTGHIAYVGGVPHAPSRTTSLQDTSRSYCITNV